MNWIKNLLKEEPVILAWLVNGGLTAICAYFFHFGASKEAAFATIVTAVVTIVTAMRTKPAHVAVISGALTTACTALAAFGLHMTTNATAALVAIASAIISLLVRANVSPR